VGAASSDDRELAAAAARGDTRALDDLLRRHADRIYAICRRVLIDPDDARDATQEAMIAVARGIARFDGRSQLTTWLYRVATNAALDEARRRARRPRPVEALPEARGDAPSLASSVSDRVAIDAAMATLAPEFRAAVALRDLVGCDYAEIAAVLDIPPGTVRSRIARGRAALAAQLGNQPAPTERQST
jgi:RNA polymerase sigma-70 factor (ECF subfamily)